MTGQQGDDVPEHVLAVNEMELAAADLTPSAFRHLVAILTELPTVLSAVVPDPTAASPV